MGRTLKRDGYTLKQVDHPDGGALGGKNPRAYQVIHDDLGFIGTVGTYSQMIEDRTPGKRYVNRRWHSERWWYRLAGDRYGDDRGQRWNEGPGEAAKRLIWAVEDKREGR